MILSYVIIFLLSFIFMEFIAWFAHRFIMHGIGWYFHKDHHQKEPGFFEKNDFFFLIFAIPSWLSIMLGWMNFNFYWVSVGFGILAYGIIYFLVHDVLIHRRFKWFDKTSNKYLIALRKAHKIHHKNLYKEKGSHFGLLTAPFNLFKSTK